LRNWNRPASFEPNGIQGRSRIPDIIHRYQEIFDQVIPIDRFFEGDKAMLYQKNGAKSKTMTEKDKYIAFCVN
jgi:hypothetical protein